MARYDDAYVEELNRRGGSGAGVESEISWGGVGGDGKYDTSKMFRSCGKMVPGDITDADKASMPNRKEVGYLTPTVSLG